jgi:hypothetical protein
LSRHASILSLSKARHFTRFSDDIVFDVISSNKKTLLVPNVAKRHAYSINLYFSLH